MPMSELSMLMERPLRWTIAPIVDSIYPLEAAGEAHARMESGAHTGKIILRMTE
ncbi:MAG: zinc-binding dehydrogenase [Halioglobus sp.]|nr:zinc-binding dehydrogenase [Halioglobus sp.]